MTVNSVEKTRDMQKRGGSNLIGDSSDIGGMAREEAQIGQSAEAIRQRLDVLTKAQIREEILEQLSEATGIDCSTFEGRKEFREVVAFVKKIQWLTGSAFTQIFGYLITAGITGLSAWFFTRGK